MKLILLCCLEILGVPEDASQDEIKRCFLILAKKYHPDMNKNKDAKNRFSEINEAYSTLGDENRRATYDVTGFSANEQDNISEQWSTTGFGNFDPLSKMKQQ